MLVEIRITEGGQRLQARLALSGRLLLIGTISEETAFYDALRDHPELVEQRLARDGQTYTYSAFVAFYGRRLAGLRWIEAPVVPRRVQFLRK